MDRSRPYARMPDSRESVGAFMEKEKKDDSFMMKLATLIVDKRKGFYLVFILLIVYSVDRKSVV